MADQQSPDGQQQQQQTATPPADGEPIRNWEDVRKIINDREELKRDVRDLRAMVEGLGEKLTTLAKPPAIEPGKTDESAKSPLEQQLESLASTVQQLASKDESAAKSERRRAITDAVVAQATDAQRDLVRGALATLALDGVIDLYGGRTQDEVDKALAKLRAAPPGAVGADVTATTSGPCQLGGPARGASARE